MSIVNTFPVFGNVAERQYVNVDTFVYEGVVDRRALFDFGVVDAKGRKVGMSRRANLVTARVEDRPAGAGGRMLQIEHIAVAGRLETLKAGDVLAWYEVSGLSTRNDEGFGSASVNVEALELETALVEFDKRVERARKAAVRKWAPK